MALRLLPSAVSPPPPWCAFPSHYKRTRSTPGHHHTHLALNRLLLSPQRPLHRAPPPPIVPHRRPSCSTLHRPLLQPVRLTAVPSPFFLNRSELPRTGNNRPPTSLLRDGDRGPLWTGAARGPRARGLGPWVSFRKVITGNSNFGHFALRHLGFSKINPQSKNLQLGPRI
jgi:hypothetical protein